MQTGRQENLPYSLSRWSDLPHAKWDWFKRSLAAGQMIGVDGRTGVPGMWSLRPEDTLGLVFWTKNPANLVKDRALLAGFRFRVHVTLTGWHEVEEGAPGIEEGIRLIGATVDAFGPDAVVWRFSPIPVLPTHDVLARFWTIVQGVRAVGLRRVYTSFLHDNDLLPETRAEDARQALLLNLAEKAGDFDLISCRIDPTRPIGTVRKGVCEDGFTFAPGLDKDACGCALTVDPFTVNESCTMGCKYCYAADRALSQIRRNTTEHA
jgi:hypothetical protein